MITTIKHNNLSWINLSSPCAEDVSNLAKEFNIHPLVAEELISPTLRSKVDIYKENLYLVLHFPVYNASYQTSVSCEIDFVISRNFIITAQHGQLAPLEDLLKTGQSSEEFREKHFQDHPGLLAFHIIKELYEFSLRQLDHIGVKINHIEEQIFNGDGKEMVKQISVLRRDILDFRRTIYPHETVLLSLEQNGKEFFGKNFVPYLSALLGEHAKVRNFTEGSKETIEALQETHESILTTKTNQVMKTLTIMAFATFPLMLFSSIFSMDTVYAPILGRKGDFWIIIGIMAAATIGMFTFFKRKKWL